MLDQWWIEPTAILIVLLVGVPIAFWQIRELVLHNRKLREQVEYLSSRWDQAANTAKARLEKIKQLELPRQRLAGWIDCERGGNRWSGRVVRRSNGVNQPKQGLTLCIQPMRGSGYENVDDAKQWVRDTLSEFGVDWKGLPCTVERRAGRDKPVELTEETL